MNAFDTLILWAVLLTVGMGVFGCEEDRPTFEARCRWCGLPITNERQAHFHLERCERAPLPRHSEPDPCR
jgi:hypothetical protein